MRDLDRLTKAEGVQGGVLAEYEARFRKFVNVRLGDQGATGFAFLASALNAEWEKLKTNDERDECTKLARLASRASIAHLEIRKAS